MVQLEEFKEGQEAYDRVMGYDAEDEEKDQEQGTELERQTEGREAEAETDAEGEVGLENSEGAGEIQELYLQYGAKSMTTNPP